MVLKNNVICRFIGLTLILSMVCGCAVAEKCPPKYPDYSTPESTFNTFFYAIQHKDYKVYLDSLAEDYQAKYGKNRKEQLITIRRHLTGADIRKNARHMILKIENSIFPDYDLRITWSEKVGARYTVFKSYMPLKKIGNEWKIVFPKSEEQSDRSLENGTASRFNNQQKN